MKSEPSVSAVKAAFFRKKIFSFYKKEGRHFPWRETKDPYKILVSEVMLQQTQADRVASKFKEFIKRFKTVGALSKASLGEVLRAWQGLGYNRRALYLKRAAEEIVKIKSFPSKATELENLPGVGPYTARAVLTFAFNKREIFIETNIRSVFIHEFFKSKRKVSDKEIISLIRQTLPKRNVSEWYQALMDYGALLKRKNNNPSRRSTHHSKQSMFRGSRREIRGKIISLLSKNSRSEKDIALYCGRKVKPILEDLLCEGFIEKKGPLYELKS